MTNDYKIQQMSDNVFSDLLKRDISEAYKIKKYYGYNPYYGCSVNNSVNDERSVMSWVRKERV